MENKAKKELIITGILIAVLVFILPNSFKQVKQKKASRVKSTARKIPPVPASKLKAKDYENLEKLKEFSLALEQEAKALKVKRDPFELSQMYESEEMPPSDLSLYGIIWNEEKPLAIINEEVLGKREKIGPYTIMDINQNSVILNDGNKDYKLELSLNN